MLLTSQHDDDMLGSTKQNTTRKENEVMNEQAYPKLTAKIVQKYGNSMRFWEENKDKLGCCYVTVRQKLNGNYSFTLEDIKIWMKILNIKPSEVYEHFFR